MPGIRATASALAAVCVVGLAACGGDDGGTIPPENGDALLAQLDDVEQSIAAGDCDTARSAAVGFNDLVNDLPDDVDADVQKALAEGGGNLVELTSNSEQCTPVDTGASGEVEQTEPAPEPPAEEETTPDEETPPADEETPPADEGGNGNQGNGNSGGGNEGDGESSGGGIGSEG
jgi:hypothetical protein